MIGNNWDNALKIIWNSPGFQKFYAQIEDLYKTKTIYPSKENVFNALKFTDYDNVKVVIMGQDPYHGVGQAHGLSFSVCKGVKAPPSLQNIYKELENDLGIPAKEHGELTGWAKQGVLLLNSVLTVEKDKASSHKGLGWELFTDYIIKLLNERKDPIVFILWGNFAREKKKYITNTSHLIIESSHPSPFSAYSGFFGSKPFSKTNDFLIQNKKEPIDWSL